MVRPLRAAIYVRKSTDDNGRTEDNKSVTRQITRGKEYIAAKGWETDDSLVFSDDGISGAEFAKRKGLAALRAAIEDFDVIVMSELSRLGRDFTRTAMEAVEFTEKGKRIFFYLTDEELNLDDATNRLILQVKSFAAEMEREKASQRVSDTMLMKFHKGHAIFGPRYGYDRVPVFSTSVSGEQVESHKVYQVNADEAKVVTAIFEMYIGGHGTPAIAKALNGDAEKNSRELRNRYLSNQAPKPPKRSHGSWTKYAVRDLLRNSVVMGIDTYGKKKNTYKGGTKIVVKSDNHATRDAPELRIISDELWSRAQHRIEEREKNTLSKEAACCLFPERLKLGGHLSIYCPACVSVPSVEIHMFLLGERLEVVRTGSPAIDMGVVDAQVRALSSAPTTTRCFSKNWILRF